MEITKSMNYLELNMKSMIYRKETGFDTYLRIDFPDQIFRVKGTYYYAPNEEYGESPNIFTQNDSRLIINHFVKVIEGVEYDNFMDCLNDPKFLDELEELIWEDLLSEDEQ